jgi:hypothetical protein
VKINRSANVVSTCGFLKHLTSANVISTGGLLKKTVCGLVSTGGCKTTASEKVDFYWPLALAALKNASANSSRITTIELLCTSGCWHDIYYRLDPTNGLLFIWSWFSL